MMHIDFNLEERSMVTIEHTDLSGRLVKMLYRMKMRKVQIP